ncbi:MULTISPECIES: TetR/AcrR family transcriptional regulator [Paracoccus]|jgi:AcrR family transcriptional regulator|uniref:TetR family transcriptional regulator n=2 Tax=Paracoccus TaxID=265 RepID=A0A5C4RAW1_9RHOB|nr:MULTISPECIES: TetR/AcrR family transcriptional regulator [Paracoccus]MBF5078234.1 TetR family transcriptional regulator [Paracoccus sp. NBH48]MCO6364799.1 TetR family transcriptional regulator [Paracoccus sp. 08]TNH41106.1 TetR family transcriptional regulator [Paracoccus haeundaensis]WDA12122.1 helix-turn-helix domain containing protein [Paracoccus marcusii]|tara:strand:+ start:192 stop:776 length:585 start_codon:yes stop_codon:yes gene_type:complete
MSPLETRRFKTAKKIQAAAIELAVRDGLPNVTTEAIARHAGISTRTFFNYYPYKEAALMGPPPDYPPEASEIFIAGKGRLIEDLGLLIEAHLARYLNERELIGAMLALSDKDPKLEALRNSAMLARRAQMRTLLHRRMPGSDERVIEILAAAIIAATNAATKDWVSGAREDFIAAAHENLSLILTAAEMLDKPS